MHDWTDTGLKLVGWGSLAYYRLHGCFLAFEEEFGKDQGWQCSADNACKLAEADDLARDINLFLKDRAWVLLACKLCLEMPQTRYWRTAGLP